MPPNETKKERETKLAEALRANLRRRKDAAKKPSGATEKKRDGQNPH